MSDAIQVTTEGSTRHLRFARPEKRNAFTHAMYARLADELRTADADAAITAVVFSGEGPAYQAGNDLGDFLADPPRDEDAAVFRFLRALHEVEVPLIAAVHGDAVGIGATMLLHCDFAVADETAVLSFPFVRLGVVPEAASSMLLPRSAGPKLAASLLLLGERIAARAALDVGLLTEVVERGRALDSARRIAERLATLPRESVRTTRALLHAAEEPVPARFSREAARFVERLESAEFRELAARALGR